jgi:hypothetical protein
MEKVMAAKAALAEAQQQLECNPDLALLQGLLTDKQKDLNALYSTQEEWIHENILWKGILLKKHGNHHMFKSFQPRFNQYPSKPNSRDCRPAWYCS